MSLVSFLKKPVQWLADLFVTKQKAQQIADQAATAAAPVVDAFLAPHKAEVIAAIDAEADRLKAAKVSSSAQVRDRFAAVAQQKAQSLGVPAVFIPLITQRIDALFLPDVYANTDAMVDALAAKAKSVVEAL